jgi:uncharacterized protein
MRPTLLLLFLGGLAFGQTMSIEEYEPKSSLVVPEHKPTRAKFPFIDVHGHQNSAMPRDRMDKLVKEMDELNMAVMVNLSGGTGQRLKDGVANMKGAYPKRFVLFANLNFQGIDDPEWGHKAAAQLEEDVRNGAQGLKIFKNLGMTVSDSKGTGADR